MEVEGCNGRKAPGGAVAAERVWGSVNSCQRSWEWGSPSWESLQRQRQLLWNFLLLLWEFRLSETPQWTIYCWHNTPFTECCAVLRWKESNSYTVCEEGAFLCASTYCIWTYNKPRRKRKTAGRQKQKGPTLTVSEASGHAGRGEGVALLWVDELADRGQLVDFSVSGGTGAKAGLRRYRSPGEEDKKRA